MVAHEEVYKRSDMLYKIKKIEASEYDLLHEGQTVYAYLHSNAHLEMTKILLPKGILDVNIRALDKAATKLPMNARLLYSKRENLVACLKRTDVLINCIFWDKTRKDHLVYCTDLRLMKPGAIIINVACDDHGAIETSRNTSHDDHVYYVDGILHYAVDNIPSGFSWTASQTLSAATLPGALAMADQGMEQAMLDDPHLARRLTTYRGMLTLEKTAKKYGIPLSSPVRQ